MVFSVRVLTSGQLMTTISSHALHPRTEQAIKASKSWSLRSLQIAQQALKENGDQITDAASATCARARTVGLQNLGMLAEVSTSQRSIHFSVSLITDTAQLQNSPAEAMKLFTQALESAKDTNFAEAKREANEAIRRLKSASSSA
jgi:tellurite resistance protein